MKEGGRAVIETPTVARAPMGPVDSSGSVRSREWGSRVLSDRGVSFVPGRERGQGWGMEEGA
eukprot:1984484-Rhodomonas_salina.1